MKPKSSFIFVRTGSDWEGIYKNGILVKEGHSLEYDDVLYVLGIDADIIQEQWIDGTSKEERLNEEGRLPLTLKELEAW